MFFENEKKIEDFLKYPSIKEDLKPNVITESTEHKDHYIKKATTSKTVTCLTKCFGRGTDFICRDEIVFINQIY